ncbi:MAG: PilZ domain-containing protein [Pseudomonadota bacterium]
MLDPALAALLAQQAGNERQHERQQIDAEVQVAFGGFAIDFKIRDISTSGIALETHGLMNFNVGDPCVLTLPGHGDVESTVVAVKGDTFHLRFDKPDHPAVTAFIGERAG